MDTEEKTLTIALFGDKLLQMAGPKRQHIVEGAENQRSTKKRSEKLVYQKNQRSFKQKRRDWIYLINLGAPL